jgi:hypothetical protein
MRDKNTPLDAPLDGMRRSLMDYIDTDDLYVLCI